MLHAAAASAGPEPEAPAPRKFSTLDLDGLAPRDIARAARSARPELDFVIPNLLAGTVAVLVGPGGVSKSMLALQTAAVIGSGLDHWNLWTEHESVKIGKVIVFNVEDPAVILDTRLHDIANSSQINPKERDYFIDTFHQNVRIWPLVGRGFAFGNKMPKTGRILPTEWMEWIEEQVDGCRLAIVDTFIRGLDGLDENASTEVAPVLAMIEAICRRKGVAFLILHHVNKASSAPGASTAQQAARGSSALTDNARWQTNLATMTEAEAQARGVNDDRKRWVQVDLTKGNYGPPIEGRWLWRGDGGVLDGSFQPAAAQAKNQAKQPVNGQANGHAAPVVRRPLVAAPDAIDRKIGW